VPILDDAARIRDPGRQDARGRSAARNDEQRLADAVGEQQPPAAIDEHGLELALALEDNARGRDGRAGRHGAGLGGGGCGQRGRDRGD
jgi:hypothetical protein